MRAHLWNHSLPAALLLLCPFDIVASLAMDLYLPATAGLPQLLHTSPATVQLTLSLYLLVLGAGQLLFGPLSDRVGRRPVLLGGASLFALSSAALAVVRHGDAFLALRVLEALGGAAMLVAVFATVRDVYADRPEGKTIYGTMSALLVLVPALGPALGAFVLELGGLAAVFGCLAAWAALAALRASWAWPETRPRQHRASVRLADVAGILRDRQFWSFTAAHGVALGGFFTALSTAPALLMIRLGRSPVAFGLWFGSIAVVLLVATRLWRGALLRHDAGWCARRGVLLVALGGALAGGGSAVFAHPLAFVAPAWLMAFGIALTVSVAAAGALAKFGATAGTATALFSCLSSVISVGGGTAAVWLVPAGSGWALALFTTVGAAFALALGSQARVRSRTESSSGAEP